MNFDRLRSKSVPKSKNTNDITQEDVDAETKQKILEALAFAAIAQDPDASKMLLQQKAAEAQAEIRGQMEATQNERERRRQEQENRAKKFPWGLEYLGQQRSLASLRAAQTERNAQKVTDAETATARDSRLKTEMADARQLTLGMAEDIAGQLTAKGVLPETQVLMRSLETRSTSASIGRFASKGTFKEDYEVAHDSKEVKGWLLSVGGQKSQHSTVLLTEDGRLLSGHGRLEPNRDRDADEGITQQLAFRQSSSVTSPVGKNVNHTYSGYLGDSYESDVVAPNAPVQILPRAYTVLNREAALQDAMVGLMSDHIPYAPEPA